MAQGALVSRVKSRVIFGVPPFRVLRTLLITYLLSPLGLEIRFMVPVGFRVEGFRV